MTFYENFVNPTPPPEGSGEKPEPLEEQPADLFEPAEAAEVENEMSVDDIYSEAAVWLCQNRQTGFKTRINGVLAQVLKKYPKDYKLKLLKHTSRKDEAADG